MNSLFDDDALPPLVPPPVPHERYTRRPEPEQPLGWDNQPIYLSPNPMVMLHGRGPEGVKCKSCQYLYRKPYHGKHYYKCEKHGDTKGAGTDMRVGWEACKLYQPEEKGEQEE